MVILSDKLGSFFDLTFHNLCPNKRSPIFGELGSMATVGWRLFGGGLEGGSSVEPWCLGPFMEVVGKARHLRL